MTIREHIDDWYTTRRNKCIELDAPAIITNGYTVDVATIKGMAEFGGLEFSRVEDTRGYRCGPYRLYHTASGPIAYFWGRFGRRLKPLEKKDK